MDALLTVTPPIFMLLSIIFGYLIENEKMITSVKFIKVFFNFNNYKIFTIKMLFRPKRNVMILMFEVIYYVVKSSWITDCKNYKQDHFKII